MTYHILHIMTRGSFLSVDRGFLVCEYPDKTQNRIAIEDIRAIIAGVQGISFTNECIAKLLSHDCVILHCDNKYKPVGWSVSLDRVVRDEAFKNQIRQNKDFENNLWSILIHHKMNHQSKILDILKVGNPLKEILKDPYADEGHVARKYWLNYFAALGSPQKREHKGAEKFENIALNYSYAVISTLIYRSILIHGLLPNLGVHHCVNYKSTPLVYDLLEPLRGFADLFLYYFYVEYNLYDDDDEIEYNLKLWIKYFSQNLKDCRIHKDKKTFKFMDAIDVYVNSVTQAFIDYDVKKVWIPDIKNHYISKENKESEE